MSNLSETPRVMAHLLIPKVNENCEPNGVLLEEQY